MNEDHRNDIIKYRIERSEETYREAILMSRENHWNACANRTLLPYRNDSDRFFEQWESVGQPFQSFLANNLLSSHLWMVAQKSGE